MAKWFVLACIPCLIINASPAFSQGGYPGTWQKSKLALFAINDFDFVDSLNGVATDAAGYVSVTTDGGHSWLNVHGRGESAKPCIGMVSCTGPKKAIIASTNCAKEKIDGDTIIFEPCEGPSYYTLAQKMYDTSYGFRFEQVLDNQNNPLDRAGIIVTHDAWEDYDSYGDSLTGSELTSRYSSEIDGVTMVDSNEVWVGINKAIYRTTNAGASWDTIFPLAGTPDSNVNPEWYDFIVNRATKEIYAKAALPPIDFAYSSDDGKTWRLDSTFKGLMYRLTVSAPNQLWGLIGGHILSGPPINLGRYSPDLLVKKLVYSSDNGLTWSIDSTTFISDSFMSILEMHWLDAQHGWIATYEFGNGPSYIWYYEASQERVPVVVGIKSAMITAYPDPAEDILYLSPPLSQVSVMDPLGREHRLNNAGDGFDITQLTPGIYFLLDEGVLRGKFVKK